MSKCNLHASRLATLTAKERRLYLQWLILTAVPICCDCVHLIIHFRSAFNPFTPRSDQFQISPVASPEILVWRTWHSDEKWLYYQILTASFIHFSTKGWENVFSNLGVKGLKLTTPNQNVELTRKENPEIIMRFLSKIEPRILPVRRSFQCAWYRRYSGNKWNSSSSSVLDGVETGILGSIEMITAGAGVYKIPVPTWFCRALDNA